MHDVTQPPPPAAFRLVTDQWTEPYWDAASQRRLVAPRCAACGTFRFPPGPFCPSCHSQDVDWVSLPGTGRIHTYTVVAVSITPEMDDSLPYAPVVVNLDGAPGVRLISVLVGAALDALRVDAAVRVHWHERADGVVLPLFVLDEGSGG